ncbi:MAG: hypothetical protein WAN61_00970 [Minisyncoccia bacterium]
MENQIPTKIELDSEEVNFGKIHRDFSETPYGKKLSDQIRWARFKPENTTNEKWNKLFGADVNNLEHLKLTYGLTRQFIKYLNEKKQLTKEEQENLLLAATVHDWAEAITGDLSYYLRTEENEREELIYLEKIIREICGQDEKLFFRMKFVIDEIVHNKDSKLGKMFNAIEKVGYVRTSIRAYNESKKVNGELKIALIRMALEATPDQVRMLLDYAKIYPPVAIYLKENKEIINDIFKDAENLDINTRKNIPKFEESREKWLSESLQL